MKPKLLQNNIGAMVLVMAAVSIAGSPLVSEAAVGRSTIPLDQVKVVDLGDRLRVEVQGGHDLAYTVTTQAAPASVTVELPGMVKGPRVGRMDVNKPPILEVIPTEVAKPRQGTRLVFRLAYPVEPQSRREGNRLVLDFPKTVPEPEARGMERESARHALRQSDPAVRVAATKPASRSGGSAHQMTKVEIQRGSAGALVKIFGDGKLRYNAKLIDETRLVVDLPDVTSALNQKLLPVDHPVLKRIRIGRHVDRVRLVFDLPKPVMYTVQPSQNYIGVRLGSAAAAGRMPESRKAAARPNPSNVPIRPDKKTPKIVRLDKARSVVPAKELSPSVSSRAASARALPSRDVKSRSGKVRLAQMAAGASAPTSVTATPLKQFKGRRISLDFQNADISNVFRLMADVSGLNIVIGEKVKAKVTMKLENVPWDQALDMLLKMNNLGMVQEGNIVWIDTLDNISKTQEAEARAEESKIKAEKLITKIVYVQNVNAGDVLSTLQQHLSPRGQVQVNQSSNALVLQDTVSKVAEFERLVSQLDLVAPQVEIEGRIVQADTAYSRSFGVQWGFENVSSSTDGDFTIAGNITGPFLEPTASDTQGEFTRDFLVNLPAAVEGLSSIPAIGFNTGKLLGDHFALDMRLSAGELLGLVKTLAAPKITTLDKQEAKIEQGESIPFQTTSLQGTQTTFVDANLTLQVTPQITSRDPREKHKNILMKVKVTRNSVGERSNPAGPSIDKKEASTQVLVRDGETMVIGGIFLDEQRNGVQGVPYFSRIPVLGWLFKQKSESVAKQELLIFLTPAIVL